MSIVLSSWAESRKPKNAAGRNPDEGQKMSRHIYTQLRRPTKEKPKILKPATITMMTEDPVDISHLVVPGQVIVTSDNDDESTTFLRGHGTYVESFESTSRLVASVVGRVQRVNKLISVIPVANLYHGQVGDLVVGRISSIGLNRWKVRLTASGVEGHLPLSGVHLPGGVQRIRTAQDARDMRHYLAEGDLVSAEVHKVQQDGTLMLHTRSIRYGKLENGTLVQASPSLIARRKNHYTTVDQFQVLWGCNGMIWIQRAMDMENSTDTEELAERQEERRKQHAATPYTRQERQDLARLGNAMECLKLTHTMLSPEPVQQVYTKSLELESPAHMLYPANVLSLTESCRSNGTNI
jgi:exosome complex component RRP4